MKNIVLVRVAAIALLSLAGGVVACHNPSAAIQATPQATQHVGPVTITRTDFDYHQTLAFSDGREVEFRHEGVDTALFEQGAVVEIEFVGDLQSTGYTNRIVSVKVLKHSDEYVKRHPELWPKRDGHWKGSSFVLDDGTARICGSLRDDRDIASGWTADVDGNVGRHSVYMSFTDRDAAKKEVEQACR